MSKFHLQILSDQQKETLHKLVKFSPPGVLAGGTALTLQLGHRKSYDFDFFLASPVPKNLLSKIRPLFEPREISVDSIDELTVTTRSDIKISFIYYPFANHYPTLIFKGLPCLFWQDIALDKAYTIGRRGEWRDYIDLYFSIKQGFLLPDIIAQAKEKFGDVFSEKLLLSQLYYTQDIADFSVELLGEQITPDEVKKFFAQAIKDIVQ